MRLSLLDPGPEPLSVQDLHDVLLVAGADVPAGHIEQWTDNERALAYDWAAREHLAASDNPVKRRPVPYLIKGAISDPTVRRIVSDTLSGFAGVLDELAGDIPPGWLAPRPDTFRAAACIARFSAAQARDGLPDPDTGQSHCAACHSADLDPDGPRCGHTAGCPEC